MRRQVVQRCPNCSAKYDVGIYVSGQKVRCRRCGIKFAVVRNDTSPGSDAPQAADGEKKAEVQQAAPEPEAPAPRPQTKQHRTAQNDIAAGTVLNGYQIGPVLGRGAMGTVYRGTQLSL